MYPAVGGRAVNWVAEWKGTLCLGRCWMLWHPGSKGWVYFYHSDLNGTSGDEPTALRSARM